MFSTVIARRVAARVRTVWIAVTMLATRSRARVCGPARRLLSCAALLCTVGQMSGVAESPEARIRSVSVFPTVAMPGSDLRVTVRIDRHSDARTLQVVVEAPSYYARTDRQLDGADAPIAHTFTWRDLPSGEYTIRATLECTQAPAVHATRTMVVLGEPVGDAGPSRLP